MPNYHYECENCGHDFEIYQSIKDSAKKKCPECKKYKLERIIHSITFNVKNEPKTVGHLAGRNRDKMSSGELAERQQKEADSRINKPKKMKKPWWRDTEKPLDLKTIKDTKKYIATGRKD